MPCEGEHRPPLSTSQCVVTTSRLSSTYSKRVPIPKLPNKHMESPTYWARVNANEEMKGLLNKFGAVRVEETKFCPWTSPLLTPTEMQLREMDEHSIESQKRRRVHFMENERFLRLGKTTAKPPFQARDPEFHLILVRGKSNCGIIIWESDSSRVGPSSAIQNSSFSRQGVWK
jgi:hypothetical protein